MAIMTSDKQRQAQAEYTPQGGELKGQRDRIIEYIARFGSITPMGAIHAFGCTKLTAQDYKGRAAL